MVTTQITAAELATLGMRDVGAGIPITVESPPSTSTDGTSFSTPQQAEVDELVRDLARAPLLDGEPLQYSQIRNECEDRAHVAAAYALAQHPDWQVGKIFVRGKLDPLNGTVRWGYHVAPYVLSRSGATLFIRVVDPAFDAEHSLSLRDWLELARGSGSVSAVLLRSADSWENDATPADGADFCSEVLEAKRILVTYLMSHRAPLVERGSLVVEQIDETKRIVWFTDKNKGKRTGWFAVRRDVMPALVAAKSSGSLVTIQVRVVDRGLFRGRVNVIEGIK